ncbi:MAG: phosphate/phosphite/phosphonate ABC transporter substrate-binding protein [Spirochaetales bacterium]|nr:phosphate/phosphite/phosphonate ABC transporter substrate-binding protein [Spirochaetales bacterium]
MRTVVAALALALSCGLGSGQSVPAPEEAIRLGIFPVYDSRTTIRIFQPLAAYLEAETGHPVRLVSAPDRETFMARARSGAFDLMWLNNAGYLSLSSAGMAYAVARGEPSFRGVAVVAADSPIRTVAELRGKRLACVSPDSVAGYLFMRIAFAEAGMDIEKDAFVDFPARVEAIPFLVIEGKADAGVFADDTYARSPVYEATKDRLRVIASSPELPQFPFCARAGLDASLAGAIREALDAIDGDTALERSFLVELKLGRIRSATDSDYDAFRLFYAKLGVK